MKRAIVAVLFSLLLVGGFAASAHAGAYRYCLNIGFSSSPMRVCLPVYYDN